MGLPSAEVRHAFCVNMCEALEIVHGARLAHGDMKPENLLLDQDDTRVVVCDFGCGRLASHDPKTVSTRGTSVYMDDEYHKNFHLSFFTDVYSVGVIMQELLQGQRLSKVAMEEDRQKALTQLADSSAGWFDGGLRLHDAVLACSDPDAKQRPTAEVARLFLTRPEGCLLSESSFDSNAVPSDVREALECLCELSPPFNADDLVKAIATAHDHTPPLLLLPAMRQAEALRLSVAAGEQLPRASQEDGGD